MKRFLALFLAISLIGCTDKALTNLAAALDATAKGMGALQTTVIQANQSKLMTDDSTEKILRLCVKIDQAGKASVAVTRAISKLTPQARGSLLSIFQPIVAAVNDPSIQSLLQGLDPGLKQNIQTILLSIQTALNTTQVILVGTGA